MGLFVRPIKTRAAVPFATVFFVPDNCQNERALWCGHFVLYSVRVTIFYSVLILVVGGVFFSLARTANNFLV